MGEIGHFLIAVKNQVGRWNDLEDVEPIAYLIIAEGYFVKLQNSVTSEQANVLRITIATVSGLNVVIVQDLGENVNFILGT